jgi:chromosome transmission fidelity protein 18
MAVTLYTTQVNSQVIRPEEKAMLSRLVNIMVSLELRFVQERVEDGQLVYKLDPWDFHLFRVDIPILMLIYRPVDTFVTYDGKRATDIAPPRYAVRHLVATEVGPLPGNW